ncbi:hypothetical protein BOTBODRAFT_171067 [Botryobasidium botryosum FD-172 SS1]|uniref:Uncharacterized protein n=1 Tax=Botryobasidium botryosum (strain FD-172 SS1) TaxID=930990 RepID=A0A067MTQ0_BOTB1|nr:hypothetical protein BOTBODRAFT_171067 [Botryobasidium botryosum FD-172 SS1]
MSSSTVSSTNATNPWARESEIEEQGYVHGASSSVPVQRDIYSRKRPLPAERVDRKYRTLPTKAATPPRVEIDKTAVAAAIPVTTFASDFAKKASSTARRAPCGASRFAVAAFLIVARCLVVLLMMIPIALIITYIAMFFMRRMDDDVRFNAVWTSVCNNSSVSFICPPPHIPRTTVLTRIPDIPELIRLQTGFEGIIELSFETTSAVDLKHSEMALRDLNILVQVSDLEAKQHLSRRLEKVVAQAKKTGQRLQKLGSNVDTTVDSTFAMDDYVLRSLDNINRELISGTIGGSVLKGFILSLRTNTASVAEEQRQELARVFEDASMQLKVWIEKLKIEAMASRVELERLKGMLDNVYETIVKEKKDVESKEEALSKLWASLIDDSRAAKYKSHKVLLDNIATYRKAALNRVQATVVQLDQLDMNLDNLGDRMAAPSLVGTQYTNQGRGLPIEAHIASVREGIEKMNDFRSRGLQRENEALERMISAPPV